MSTKSPHNLHQPQGSVDAFLAVLNGLDTFVYVADYETNELLFMNDEMAAQYNLQDGAYLGRVCWEAMHPELSERCAECPALRLEDDLSAVVTWEEIGIGGEYYRNTNRLIQWEGRRARLHYRVNISELKVAESALTKRLQQQELMSGIAQSFISTDDISRQIIIALRRAGTFLGADRVLLGRHNPKTQTIDYEYQWFVNQRVGGAQSRSIPFVQGMDIYEALVTQKAGFIICGDVRNDERYTYLAEVGIISFIAVPIYVSNQFWGMMNIASCNEQHRWTQSDVHLVKLIDGIISGALTRDDMQNDLAHMSSVVNSAPQYITIIDMQGRIVYMNPGAIDMCGYSFAEMVQHSFYVLFTREGRQRIAQEILPAMQKQGFYTYELPILRKDGKIRTLSFSFFKVSYSSGYVGTIASDITERLQLEAELVTAKEQAEESNRAKSEFLSRMSHEIRTPMNAIIGMTSIAQDTDDADKGQHCLDRIEEASKHLLGVINDILDMSKIEADKFELNYTEFSLEKMLMRVVGVINFRSDEKEQTLVIHLAPDLPTHILSDEQRLAQIIINLLSNAVKFTPKWVLSH